MWACPVPTEFLSQLTLESGGAEEMQVAVLGDGSVAEEWQDTWSVGWHHFVCLQMTAWSILICSSFFFFLWGLISYIALFLGFLLPKKKKKSKLCWIPFHIICLFNLLSWSSYFLFSFSFCTVTLFDRWLCEILGIPPCFFSEASPFWKWFSSVIWIFCPFQLCPEF